MNEGIKVIDNFLTDVDFSYVLDYCRKATYLYGEVDDYSSIPPGDDIKKYVTGMIHQVFPSENLDSKILNLIDQRCRFEFPILEKFNLKRAYINCFSPGENPIFHIDTPDNITRLYTCLYYLNQDWDINEGGETQFYVDDIIYGIPPIPNRMIIFDGSLMHRATSFKNYHRFSIAFKYCKDE